MKQYLELLKTIKAKGTYKPAARENMPGTKSLFGYQFRHNLSDGFPVLTTKKIFWKGVVIELLWFLRGDTNIKYLVDNGVNIWNEDAYQYYCKVCSSQGITMPMRFDSFIDMIKRNDLEHTDIVGGFKLGDCGFQYGKVWREWEKVTNDEQPPYFENKIKIVDQIKNVINSLKKTPESRRHIVTAVDPSNDTGLALYWCHAMFQFNCRPLTNEQRQAAADIAGIDTSNGMFPISVPKYYLDCQLYQRSADVVLGVPFNIASYALLVHIMANICNMIPGEFIHTFGDVHIYDNHNDAVETQLQRTPSALPKLTINTEFWNPENVLFEDVTELSSERLTEFIEGWKLDDFQLIDYAPQSTIKAELSTGIKK